MKVYEHNLVGSRSGSTARPEHSSTYTWRIGKGRVTAAEIESWQLGPDLTQLLYAEETSEQS